MTRRIEIVEGILSVNDQIAAQNQATLAKAGIFSLNLMASPGAGKTSLIELTLGRLVNRLEIAVIDGDIATDIDAQRASNAGAIAYQVNTGGECHLDAKMVNDALAHLPLVQIDILIVENVGNLICPASFKLGTHKSILIASIPEGDDKPYKYPGMYRGVDALVINKIDLLPYIPFNMEYFKRGVELLNPGLINFELSCQTKQGIEPWVDWILSQVDQASAVQES